jgi:uncharacterized membrane protein
MKKIPLVKKLQFFASISLVALIFLCLFWEILLAPLNKGSLLFLKTLPLLAPLFGILKGHRYTYQWASMLILLYFIEGVVRAWSDQGLSAQLAMIETILSIVFFGCAIFYARHTRNVS